MLRFVRGEPPDLRVLVVRDPRLASPSCDEEEVMAEKLLRRGIDVFVDPEEPGLGNCDPQPPPQRAGPTGQWPFPKDQKTTPSGPHALAPHRARSRRSLGTH